MADFPMLLNRHRVHAGMSQNRLAKAAGIDPAYVNRLERAAPDSTSLASRKVVLALATALELTDRQTDRFLFASGHAPQRDYQQLWEAVEPAIETIRRVIDGDAENVLAWRAG